MHWETRVISRHCCLYYFYVQCNAATKKSHISSAPSYDVDCSVSRVPKSRIEIHCLGENNKAAYCCSRYWQGCWNQEGRRGLVPPQIFDRLVDPISTGKGRLCLTYYYSPPAQIFRPSYCPDWCECSWRICLFTLKINFGLSKHKGFQNIDVDFGRKSK